MLAFSFFKYIPFEITDYTLTIENYAKFFGKQYYIDVLLYTIKLSLLISVITLVLAYPIAYFFTKTVPRLKQIGIFLSVLPIMIGLVVRTYGLIALLEEHGIVNRVLMFIRLIERPLQILDTPAAGGIGLVVAFLPFAILPLMTSLEKIDTSIEAAGRVLGCNQYQLFRKITLPLSIPGIVSAFLLVFSMAVTVYVTPILLAGPSMMLMSTLIYQQMLVAFNWPFGTALSTILIVFAVVFLLIYMKYARIEKAT
jgi:ABC-type spermidine/putrescine transport system permease subunit I